MQPTAVFDLDGTLLDTATDIQAALYRVLLARGLPGFARAEVVAMIGDGAQALIERAFAARGAPYDPTALAEFLHDDAVSGQLTTPFEGVSEALQDLLAAGWRLAVCTNKPAAPARRLLQNVGFGGLFAAIGGGDSFATRKPDPAHLLATLREAGGEPAHAVMIGDHRNDMMAAAGAGVAAIFAGWGYGPRAMAGDAPIAEQAAELPALLAARRRG